jgi:urease gamma subunit
MDGAVKRRKAAKVPELVVAPGTFEDYAVAIGLPTLHGAVERVREIRGERAAAARASGERGIVRQTRRRRARGCHRGRRDRSSDDRGRGEWRQEVNVRKKRKPTKALELSAAARQACSAAAEMIAEGLRVQKLEQAALGAEQVARELRGGLTMVDVARAALVVLTPNEIAELLEQMPVIKAAQELRDGTTRMTSTDTARAKLLAALFAELEAAKL